ncbi:TIGR00701 family protein [Aliidiomarina minuta]|uniref:Protoporphyrinogen IX oxidase n=1 Tax=Aliidiomarina minuta TaxID=880057 RepID=A0A432W470_9GAMM|nr:CopD family protein [Aliidiomarina minuta]RUO24291.1 TIGR00701 family protein [Aliidiomarina minuta]
MKEFLLLHTDWLKALHISFMVAWFAGIFYLPRLFVYHAENHKHDVHELFKVMERRLLFFVTPFALLTLIFGLGILYAWGVALSNLPLWLHIKFVLVALLYLYHIYCFKLLADFRNDLNTRSSRWYRVFNEIPVLLLFAIIILAVVKP